MVENLFYMIVLQSATASGRQIGQSACYNPAKAQTQMNLDIKTAVITAFAIVLIAVLITLWIGISTIRRGRKIFYFRKRQQLIAAGWRWIFGALVLGGLAFLINRFAEPAAYRYFPPTPTVTMTPTITLTPTISLTPTITDTPTITPTPAITNTPALPEMIVTQMVTPMVPNPNGVFSPLTFARVIDQSNLPVEPSETFSNPVVTLYAAFSFDKLVNGSQWTAIWYRGTELICYETAPWSGGSGGFGFTECSPGVGAWLPGEYEVQLFMGFEWKQSGRFTIIGDPPPTQTPTFTPTLSPTVTATRTATGTQTLVPSATITLPPTITKTRTPTITPTPTITRWPTYTTAP